MTWDSVVADFEAHFWIYISMPLIAGFIGYITKSLALEMMFRPIEFKGIKPYLGWQGVVPRKAGKMASTATDLLMERILSPSELMEKLDPDRMIKELDAPMRMATDQLVREIGETYVPGFWKRMPELGKQALIIQVQKQMPRATAEVWKEVSREPEYYIDFKHLLVSNLIKDKELLNDIFKEIGKKEFSFFRNAGFWFGLSLGFIQLGCWLAWHQRWLLPAFGGFIGLVSDWLALQMLFRPLQQKKILGFKVQGLFISRQKEVARDYAALIAKELLTPANMIEEVLRGPFSDRLIDLLQKHVKDAIDQQMGLSKPLVLAVAGSHRYNEIRELIVDRVVEMIPEHSQRIEKYAMDALDINNLIAERMDRLTPEEFEGMLRPAFKEDEKTLIICGAVLGFLIGELQVQLLL